MLGRYPPSFTTILAAALLPAAVLAASCGEPESGARAPGTGTDGAPGTEIGQACDAEGVREVVDQLGARLNRVSLLAADSIVRREIRREYTPLVTGELLESWISDPASAPGREVSSPWPDRIAIQSVESSEAGVCRVEGEIVYVTSTDVADNGEAALEPVTLHVRNDDGWRISAFESTLESGAGPADIVRRYYAAIAAGAYRRAYELWGNGGAASGQSYEEFAAGFAEMARVNVRVTGPGRVEGAAGSRYVEVPVIVEATTSGGQEQRLEGTYTLRRAVVEGASADQRRWHIYSADISRQRANGGVD